MPTSLFFIIFPIVALNSYHKKNENNNNNK
jgi:hypothetical protein